MALRRYRIRVWIFLASIVIPAAIYGVLGIELFRQSHAPRLRAAFYAAGLVLALAVTLICRFVVWQDYRRESKAAELRSAFVARVSHELRTPLTSIRMMAETLSLGRVAEPERQRQYLDTIVRETERLSGMVENVLEFSRTESPIARMLQPVALRPLVEDAIDRMRPRLEQEGFELRLDCGVIAGEVRVDRDALQQAIANLLENALKYSGDSRRIEVRAAGWKDEARIDVADWGVGIAPQYREKIFERFYRVPGASENAAGVGLGLSLVAEIMRTHGGRAEVRENAPQGSVFSLVLPMVRS